MKPLLFLVLLFFPVALAKLLGGSMYGTSFLARQTDGQVYGWGSNGLGMLGVGLNAYTVSFPTKMLNVISASDVSSGAVHNCIVDQGQAKCAGRDILLGRSTVVSDSNVLVNVEGLGQAGTISQVFLGNDHSCLLTANAAVWCWGDANSGKLANPATAAISVPGKVAGYGATSAAIDVAVGTYHTCVLFIDGTVGCAGWNRYGQLGVGDETDRLILTQVQGGLSNVVSISAGYYHTCAVAQNGDVYCWGYGDNGQLGLGRNVHRKYVLPTIFLLQHGFNILTAFLQRINTSTKHSCSCRCVVWQV